VKKVWSVWPRFYILYIFYCYVIVAKNFNHMEEVMLSQSQIVKHLRGRNLATVAQECSLSYISVNRLVKDPERSCHQSTLRLLSEYLIRGAEEILNDDAVI